MKRENLIKRDDFWKESLREMQILHWQDSELTIKEILKLKNELINSLSGNTVKLVKGCTCSIYHGDSNNEFCTLCGKELYPNLQPE